MRRRVVLGTLLLIALLTIGLLAASAMMQRSPAWWRRVDTADPRTLRSAQAVENGLTTLFHQERDAKPRLDRSTPIAQAPIPTSRIASEDWRFTLRAADANAWLNTRLPAWITRREDLSAWPKEIEQIQVDFHDGMISIGAQVRAAGVLRVLSADVIPQIRPDGSLWLPARAVRVGTLPLPTGVVLRGARQQANDMVPVSIRDTADSDLLWRAFLGDAALAQNPTIRLPDGRRVRILNLRSQHGVLEVTCRTEWDAAP